MRRKERQQNVGIHVHVQFLRPFYLTFYLSTGAAPSLPGGDDPSAKMWSLSISQASEHDLAMAERWKSDMDGILIYVRSTWFIDDSNPINVWQRSPDRCFLCDGCCISRRQLQDPQARFHRRVLQASSANHAGTRWDLQRRSTHPPNP